MSNTDDIAIESPEECEAFALIDSTASQVEQLTLGKPKVIGRLAIELDGAEMGKFGSYVVAKTCEGILKAVESGITHEELKETLRTVINSNLESAGADHGVSK